MRLHTIGGPPRAGSTLLERILRQNPRFAPSSTSALADLMHSMAAVHSAHADILSDLAFDKERTERRGAAALRAFAEQWHKSMATSDEQEVFFDKSRIWALNAQLTREVLPDSVFLICVRDPVMIAASIEKANAKNPLFNDYTRPTSTTLAARINLACSIGGYLGENIAAVNDLMHRQIQNVEVVRYEDLCENPKRTIQQIYAAIDEPYYKHDFDHVEDSAENQDHINLHKWPHHPEPGPVKLSPTKHEDWIPGKMGEAIRKMFPEYCRMFNYRG